MASLDTVEDDLGAVGRERRIQLLIDARHGDHRLDLAVEGVQEQQLASALAADEKRQRVAVRCHGQVHAADGAGRQPLRDDVLVVGLEALREVLEELALAAGEDDDVGVLAQRRDRSAQVAGGEGPDRELGRLVLGQPHAVAEVDGLALLGQDLDVALAQVPPEADVELLGRDVERALEDPVHSGAELAAVLEHEVAHAVLAPLGLDEVEDRVAEPVGEEAVDAALGDFGHLVGEDRVAQDHLVLAGLVVPEVGRHAFREPLRRVRSQRPQEVAAEENLELEDVGQFVRDELGELDVGQVHRKHHPVSSGQGEGPDAFRDEVGQRVGLLELRVRRVIDDVDRLGNLEVQVARDLVVRAFGVGGDLLQRDLLPVVEVDDEVRRPVDLPGELVVDDLVLAEIRVVGRDDLTRGGSGEDGAEGQSDQRLLHEVRSLSP